MAGTVADFMLSRLSEWGVRRIYGFPVTALTAFWAR
jgi:hypothetical protein